MTREKACTCIAGCAVHVPAAAALASERSRADRLEQDLEQLREALAPFAEMAAVYDHWTNPRSINEASVCPPGLTVAHLRAAAALLASVEENR